MVVEDVPGAIGVVTQLVPDYSVYVMRQASRRSWRIGQTRPVKVVFMSYRNTLQADALKLQSSLAVEGELPEDGLAAYGDDGDDLMMALARKIVSGEEDDAETVEEFSVFQSTQKSTVLMGSRFGCDRDCIDLNRLRRLQTSYPLVDRRSGLPTTLRVQTFSGGPILTIDRTIFEMWLGAL